MSYLKPSIGRPRRSSCADEALRAELGRISRMTIEERVKAALTLRERFDWLQPEAGKRIQLEKWGLQDEEQTNLQVADRIAGMLAASNVPCVVIGAIALAAHRYVRFTENIDLGVLADLPRMRSLVDSLRAAGYDVEFHEPDEDDPLGGVIDVSGPFGLVQLISFEGRFPAEVLKDLQRWVDGPRSISVKHQLLRFLCYLL